ncbi:MAG: sensor histidine kinase [Thermodesulfobacteriota bacterium]|nr:sensor histidine kinase [Thermodesulfobacteriota bacterium]
MNPAWLTIALEIALCFFSCMFAYYAFRYAWFVKKAVSRQYMAGGAVLFIVSSVIGLLHLRSDTIASNAGGWVNFSFWITGIIFVFVGQIHTVKSLQKIYPVPLYQLILKVKRGGYYLVALLILLLSIPVGAVSLKYASLSALAMDMRMLVDIGIRMSAVCLLGIATRMDFRGMALTSEHDKDAIGLTGFKNDGFSLYQEEIAYVCGYTDTINYFLSAMSPVLDKKVLCNLLSDWGLRHPILFEKLHNTRIAAIDKTTIGKHLNRIFEKDRLRYLVEEFSSLTAYLVKSLGALTTDHLADQTLKTCYERLQNQYAGHSVIFEVLKSVPDGFLKEEKLTLLSKEELETKVRQQTLELRRQKDELAVSLAEKEILLREIHHRVKNNLQIISSLLGLQANAFQDQQAKALFSESRNRIKTMATVHELLYQSDSLARVDFGKYIKNLTGYLWRAYECGGMVTLQMDTASEMFLDIDQAVPCGLILNELVSNSLKYAFPEGKTGEVKIVFKKNSDNSYVLSVFDNGVGFPAQFDIHEDRETLGLRLVSRLVDQLEGQLSIETNPGARFTIRFS